MNGNLARSLAVPENAERRWSRLAMIWALYYLAAFTLGNIPQYMQKTIWFGAGGVGLFTVPVFWKYVRFRHLPREGVLLGLFVLWALTGIFVATDMVLFVRFLKLMLELTIIVTSVSLILEHSGQAKWMYLAFLGVAVLRVLFGESPVGMGQITQTPDSMARIEAANSVGFLCALGVLGMFAFMGETKSLGLRAALIAGGSLALYGVILSASRSAFTAFMVIAILWPTMCLAGGARVKMNSVVGAAIVLLLVLWTYQFVIHETYMGVRFTKATQMEDSSTQGRFELVFISLRVFATNPIFGCGLGQFGIASGTGLFAHQEIAEILATTGLPGFVLYYSVYVIAWRRLTWSLRYLRDPLDRYRINIARISLLALLISGVLSRINFLSQESMFQVAMAIGMGNWAQRMAQMACRSGRTGYGFDVSVPGFSGQGTSSQLRVPPASGRPFACFIDNHSGVAT